MTSTFLTTLSIILLSKQNYCDAFITSNQRYKSSPFPFHRLSPSSPKNLNVDVSHKKIFVENRHSTKHHFERVKALSRSDGDGQETKLSSLPIMLCKTLSAIALTIFLTMGSSIDFSSFDGTMTSSWHFSNPANAAVAPLADVGLKEFLVKDGNEFLRLSLPTSLPISADPETLGDTGRAAQQSIELARLRLEQVGFSGKTPIWNASLKDVNKAKSLVSSPNMLKNISQKQKATELVDATLKKLDELVVAVRNQDITSTLALQEESARLIYDIRTLSMPPGVLPYSIPDEYAKMPQLRGRATVDCTIKKRSGSYILPDGTRSADMTLKLVVDGYQAPLTGGNFINLINKKFYDNMPIQTAEELIVQTGKSKDATVSQIALPLEIFYKNDKAPTYGYTSDDDMRATESFSLPFQAYGAMGMEHDEEDVNTASSEFWFLKWDQSLVTPGRNTLDGSHSCFGYVVENQDLLSQLGKGDVIVNMVVLKGGENLVIKG